MVARWLEAATAQKVQPNPNAMTLATIDPDGRPSARIVLAKGVDVAGGTVTFHTNRLSRKGAALTANPRAALVFHWDALDRQVRIEGPVTLASDAESDAYFATRRAASRIGAWASDQSQPIASRDALLEKVVEAVTRFGVDFENPEAVRIPRPPHWGGYRVWAEWVELWIGSEVRVHDRARWVRTLTPRGDGFAAGAWTSTRLQP
jgi:pyridoxamine 5'-phosphate oxidase